MQAINPLQKYFRQPKIYVQLPSKGLYYPPGTLLGDYNNVPIFAMNGMDEILYKTPDALFSGEATVKVIESCCPYIKDAGQMPGIDVDMLIIAIRIATFGDLLPVSKTCPGCGEENTFEVDLKKYVDYFNSLHYSNKIEIGEITVTLRPLTYKELTEVNLENFKMQKMLIQSKDIEDDKVRQEQIDEVYRILADVQTGIFIKSIETVQIPEGIVDEKDWIAEWVKNSERELFDQIKTKLEENKRQWELPKQPVMCPSCSKEDQIDVELDQANFFVKS
jgi:hypothetical protein